MFKGFNKSEDESSPSVAHLDVLLSELRTREQFLQSQLRDEATNYLAVLSSVGAAATIYLDQVLKADGNGKDISSTIILALALVSLWFPANHVWHMAENRAAGQYAAAIAGEIRQVIMAKKESVLMTWEQFRLKEIAPQRKTWFVTASMIIRAAVLFIPSTSLASYSVWGLEGRGTFQAGNAIDLVLLFLIVIGTLITIAGLILPYWKFGLPEPG